MSCRLCPCHFEWPVDTVGFKRDPISCEKAWLDFAVRLLSREAVGKGRGQETVWSSRCEPAWWKAAVPHPWKNPTANPKDGKEVLLEKYTALESHLRAEHRFPKELEEESRLWREGRYRELFLLTSLTSLLGKVTSVHSAVEDACSKVKELNASVNQSILANIKSCLTSSLRRTETLNAKSCSHNKEVNDLKGKSPKRHVSNVDKENSECSPIKQQKIETHFSQKQSTGSINTASNSMMVQTSFPQKDNSTKTDSTIKQSNDILALAQKLLSKRRKMQQNTESKLSTVSKTQKQILPKPVVPSAGHFNLTTTAPPSLVSNCLSASPNNNFAHPSLPDKLLPTPSESRNKPSVKVKASSVPPQPLPLCIRVSPEQIGLLLSQNSLQLTEILPNNLSPVSLAQSDTPSPVSSQSHNHATINVSTDCSNISSAPAIVSTDCSSISSPEPLPSLSSSSQRLQSCELRIDSSNMPGMPALDTVGFENTDLDEIEKLCDEVLNENNASFKIGHENALSAENLLPQQNENSDVDLSKIDVNLINCSSGVTVNNQPRSSTTEVCSKSRRDTVCGSDIGYFSDSSPSSQDPVEDHPMPYVEPFDLLDDGADFLLDKYLFGSEHQT